MLIVMNNSVHNQTSGQKAEPNQMEEKAGYTGSLPNVQHSASRHHLPMYGIAYRKILIGLYS